MWNFTKYGFTSVVAYDPTKDKKPDSPFPKIAKQAGTHLLVRARIKADLDQLKRFVPSLVVDTDAGADYAYRAVITRSQMKKFMCTMIDEIDYDSHFKEAARDNSPLAPGRYQAMMGVWTEMSRLQDISPWSGGNRGWTSTYGSGKGASSKEANPGLPVEGDQSFWDQLDAAHSEPPQPQGAPTVDDFMADPGFYGSKDAWRTGSGPRTGYKPGDTVYGYAGKSTVTKVDSRSNGKPDLVQTKRPSKVGKSDVTSTYASNYLVPDLTDYLKAARPERNITLDGAYDLILNNRSAKVEAEILTRLDDHAFELVTRMQEREGEYSTAALDESYSEIQWEMSDADEKRQIASQGTVPAKYEAEAQQVLNEVAAEVASDAAGS